MSFRVKINKRNVEEEALLEDMKMTFPLKTGELENSDKPS